MIELEIEITKFDEDFARFELKITSGVNNFKTFDYLTNDKIEELEVILTNAVSKLYEYRKQGE